MKGKEEKRMKDKEGKGGKRKDVIFYESPFSVALMFCTQKRFKAVS